MWSKASDVLDELLHPIPFPSGKRWDQDLSSAELRRLSWPEKQLRAVTALERKVLIVRHASISLDNFLAEPILPKAPRERIDLREWSDPARGLWRWIDVKLDNPELKNHAAMKVFFKALSEIDELKSGKQSSLRKQLEEKTRVIKRLETQNAELLEEVNRLRTIVYSGI